MNNCDLFRVRSRDVCDSQMGMVVVTFRKNLDHVDFSWRLKFKKWIVHCQICNGEGPTPFSVEFYFLIFSLNLTSL